MRKLRQSRGPLNAFACASVMLAASVVAYAQQAVQSGAEHAIFAIVAKPIPPSGAALMLDNIDQTVLFSYGMHRHRTAYTGYLIRIRDLTSDVETDLCNGSCSVVTTTMIDNACGANRCSVTTWYDQSGNSRDATQSTEADMPYITDSGGTPLTCGSGSVPCMRSDPTGFFDNQFLSFETNAAGLSSNPGVVYYVMYERPGTTGESGCIVSAGYADGARYCLGIGYDGSNHLFGADGGNAHYTQNNPSAGTFGYYEQVWAVSGTYADFTGRRNGSALSSHNSDFNSTNTPNLTNTRISVCASTSDAHAGGPDVSLSELTAMAAYDADDRTDIETAESGWD